MDFQAFIKNEITSISSVSGGDINDAFKIETKDKTYFAKVNSSKYSKDILRIEARSLKLLKSKAKINVPEVILAENIQDKSVLILNWIEPGHSSSNTSPNFAIQLAQLHQSTNLKFGLEFNNYIGSLPQVNIFSENWLEFYNLYRIQYQLKLAVDSGKLSTDLVRKSDRMFLNIEKDFPLVKPSLLHGDMWSGNYIINEKSETVFIDPAVYYGHREIDIAMMKLFGGFDDRIYSHYNSIMPLEKSWQDRIKFYQLYYILVHVNLFGGSYRNSTINILNYYGG